MKWNVFHICLPHISVYKMDNLLLFLYFVFQILNFVMMEPFYTLLMARGLRPGRKGQHDGIHTGTKQRGNTTGNQTGGNNEKMRNVTFILGYIDTWLYGLYVVIWVICCFMGYVGYLWLFSTILYTYIYICVCVFFVCFIHNQFSNIQWFIFKTSIAERNFHLINRSPSFRKCSNWNLPKNSKQHLYSGNADFGTNDSKEKCSCM